MFKPRIVQPNWYLYSALLIGSVGLCYLLEVPWWSYVLTTCLNVSIFGWSIWNTRQIQIKEHQLVKAKGLQASWEGRSAIKEHMTVQEFIALFDSRLDNEAWREALFGMINQAKWVGVTDHFTNPYTFRWEFHCSMPKEWTADDRFCLYVALMACLPTWLAFQLEIDDKKMILKNGATYTSNIPRSHIDAPPITLQFWNYFQRHMQILLDRSIAFNVPVFQAGLAEDIDIVVPATFELAEGGTLNVEMEDNHYCVSTLSKEGIQGTVQKYASANDFWWVWRNAIEQKPLN